MDHHPRRNSWKFSKQRRYWGNHPNQLVKTCVNCRSWRDPDTVAVKPPVVDEQILDYVEECVSRMEKGSKKIDKFKEQMKKMKTKLKAQIDEKNELEEELKELKSRMDERDKAHTEEMIKLKDEMWEELIKAMTTNLKQRKRRRRTKVPGTQTHTGRESKRTLILYRPLFHHRLKVRHQKRLRHRKQ